MKSNNFFRVALSVFVSFVFVFAVTYAATTISTNISTGGTLTVTGTANVTGLTTLVNATSTMLTVSGNTYLATTTLTGGSPLVLGTLSADPTGRSEGSVYYNSGSKVVKLYDGSNWFTVGTTTSGLTLSGQRLQLADLNYYTTFGTTTQSGLSVLTLEATSTAAIPLTLRGYNAQTADLFRIHNVAGTELFAIDAVGNASTTIISTSGAIWVGGNATTTSAGAFSANGLATFMGGATTTTLTLLNGEIISNATDGVIQLGGVASTTSLTLLNGETITNATDGTIALTGALTVSGVSSFTGLATFLGGATTTILTLLNGEIISNGTDGVIQLGGIASTTSLTLLNGETITNATDGEVQITATTLKLIGTASTSAIKVGDEPAAPTIEGMVFGYCSFGNVTLAASTTEGFADCTTVPVGALLANDRVFVQATSSFESMYVITAASTTGVSTIQLRILNTGLGVADGELTGTSVNFWAVR